MAKEISIRTSNSLARILEEAGGGQVKVFEDGTCAVETYVQTVIIDERGEAEEISEERRHAIFGIFGDE